MDAEAHDFLRTESLSGRSSERTIKTIVQSMAESGWVGSPIAVVEHGGEKYILDGHHRTFAARRANIRVQYRIVDIAALHFFGYNSIDEVVKAHAEAGVNRIH